MTGSWIKLIIAPKPDPADYLGHILRSRGAEGLEEKPAEMIAYFSPDHWPPGFADELAPLFPGLNFSVREIPDENWMENWKENFKPFTVAPNLIIAPDWVNLKEPENGIVLYIAPKMAFGTGHHETTQLLLTWLNEMDLTGRNVLDAGTGSGVLSILAVRRGAGQVTGFDNDPLATENALENEGLNPVPGKIKWITGTLSDVQVTAYDLIVANINRNILLDLCPAWLAYTKPQTQLLLSGLLIEDEAEIRQTYTASGWQCTASRYLGEWVALYFKKEGA
jgi:ribosomal protein L11 methyltransferase